MRESAAVADESEVAVLAADPAGDEEASAEAVVVAVANEVLVPAALKLTRGLAVDCALEVTVAMDVCVGSREKEGARVAPPLPLACALA